MQKVLTKDPFLQPRPALGMPIFTVMTPAQWAAIPDNPIQRNTEKHLAGATHLLTPQKAHADVMMGVTPDGKRRWKLDGHTRSLLWSRRPDLAPEKVYVRIHEVADEAEAEKCYGHYDNKAALETASDKLSGAFHKVGWAPKSSFLQRGALTTGIARASMIADGYQAATNVARTRPEYNDIYQQMPRWLPELQILDGFDISNGNKRWPSAVVTTALLTMRRYPRSVEFWRRYAENAGIKTATHADGVEVLSYALTNSRKSGATNNAHLIGHAISCVEAWLEGRSYMIMRAGGFALKASSLDKYVEKRDA